MPRLREPTHRTPGRDLTMTSGRQRSALLIQSRGIAVSRKDWCSKCDKGGKFDACVVLPHSETKACASCKYGGDRCDFATATPKSILDYEALHPKENIVKPRVVSSAAGDSSLAGPSSSTPRLQTTTPRGPASTASKRRAVQIPSSAAPAAKRTRLQSVSDTPIAGPALGHRAGALPTAFVADPNDIRAIIRQELALHRAQENQIRTLIQNEISSHLPELMEHMGTTLTASVSNALVARFAADPDLVRMDETRYSANHRNSGVSAMAPPMPNMSGAAARNSTHRHISVPYHEQDYKPASYEPQPESLLNGPVEANPDDVAAAVAHAGLNSLTGDNHAHPAPFNHNDNGPLDIPDHVNSLTVSLNNAGQDSRMDVDAGVNDDDDDDKGDEIELEDEPSSSDLSPID